MRFGLLLLFAWVMGCSPPAVKPQKPAMQPISLTIHVVSERKHRDGSLSASTPAEAAPTPIEEVRRVLRLLPRPQVAFCDPGCGDGRWVIEAAKLWGCRAIGVEIDARRADEARENVRQSGLEHLITILNADATTLNIQADVWAAYLYPDVLQKLLPQFQRATALASYMHQPPGLPVVKNGNTYIFRRGIGVWQGVAYDHLPNPGCNCPMCVSLYSQGVR